jgi:uncharacterized protein (TIGR04222 family)
VHSFFDSRTIKDAAAEYKAKLQQLRLLPDKQISNARTLQLVIALGILLGFALISIVAAAMRGRHNVFFLLLLAGVFCSIAIRRHNPFRTALGNALLADIKTLFQPLKNRASMIIPGGATGEAALLMAVFGIGALPSTKFPTARQFEDRRRSTTCGGGGGCGDGCSSCSGSGSCGGGGSGCGGGGGCGGGS